LFLQLANEQEEPAHGNHRMGVEIPQNCGKTIKDVDGEEAERWLKAFMSVYEQAAISIHKIAELDADGFPADLITLLEGSVKLPPMLKCVKEIPKPKEKELRKLKQDSEHVLDACIKASEWGVKLSQDRNRARLSNIVFWTSMAISSTDSLSKRLGSLTQK
jgi:hypothetical protein